MALGLAAPRPLVSGWWEGGGSEAKKKFVYLKSTPNFGPVCLILFFPKETFSDGGGGGQCYPPPRVSLSKGLPQFPLSPPPPPPHTPPAPPPQPPPLGAGRP